MTETRNHVVLRDHLVRRLPTGKDLRGRVSLVLTARDREILTAIDQHGLLTADLIDLAFFPSDHSKGRASSAAYERLRQLWLGGFVERIELPVARVVGGSRPYLYCLARPGARFLDVGSEVPARRRRLERSSELYVDHNLAVASFWANLMAVIRSRPISLGLWVPERDIRARRLRVKDPRTHRPLPFLPDAYFELHYANGRVQGCLLEVDQGTQSLPRLRHKLRAFELSLTEGLFARTWQRDDFEVLVVGPSKKRLENIRSVAREVVESSRWDAYQFATQVTLERSGFAEAEWRCLDGEAFGLLYADSVDGSHQPDQSRNVETR